MSKIISCILNVLLAIMMIVIIVGAYYMYQVKIQKKDYANLWGYSLFEVGTGSMSPTIEIGDVVITKITKDVEENDIIVYIEDDDIITHRLIEKNEERLITRGDTNNSDDKPIEKPDAQENLKGTLAFEDIWPDGGDYDMNDVILEYNRAIYFNTENMINKIVDTFTPTHDGAMYDNALFCLP